jgi:hypothetical protein
MLHKLSTLQDIQGLYDWFKVMRNTQPVWLDESSGCGCVSSTGLLNAKQGHLRERFLP